MSSEYSTASVCIWPAILARSAEALQGGLGWLEKPARH